jgi:hypothetical protein
VQSATGSCRSRSASGVSIVTAPGGSRWRARCSARHPLSTHPHAAPRRRPPPPLAAVAQHRGQNLHHLPVTIACTGQIAPRGAPRRHEDQGPAPQPGRLWSIAGIGGRAAHRRRRPPLVVTNAHTRPGSGIRPSGVKHAMAKVSSAGHLSAVEERPHYPAGRACRQPTRQGGPHPSTPSTPFALPRLRVNDTVRGGLSCASKATAICLPPRLSGTTDAGGMLDRSDARTGATTDQAAERPSRMNVAHFLSGIKNSTTLGKIIPAERAGSWPVLMGPNTSATPW